MARAVKPLLVSIEQARCLQLAAQGLLTTPSKAATPLALRRSIARMQLLQIDTIHVVARSPYLVLHARLGDYPMPWLEQSLAKGYIAETWAHEACFAPTADMPLHRSYNDSTRYHWGVLRGERLHQRERQQLDQLLGHVREHGAVKSSHFERKDGRSGGWWGWKDEKLWLEALFARGELMVARRENFQRVYDLPERVCPSLHAATLPDAKDVHEQFIDKAVQALGITQARWIHDYFRIKPRLKDADLDDWVEQGRLLRVQVQGWEAPAYVHPTHAKLLRQARRGQLQASHTALLSPFDPIVWDRERVQTLFDFEYRIECYTPEAKRQYGYFVLPVLHRGQLVARLDAKAHRADGVFEVKAFFLQPRARLTVDDAQAIAQAMTRSAVWHGTPRVSLCRSAPSVLRKAVATLA